MATKKNQLIIDLGNITLTDEQRKSLINSIHNAVTKRIKASPEKVAKKATTPKITGRRLSIDGGAGATNTQTVTLKVTFTNVNPGLSSLTATSDAGSQTISRSGNIILSKVKSGEIIAITGKSLGSTTVSIDVSADPMQMNFPPGKIDAGFFIN